VIGGSGFKLAWEMGDWVIIWNYSICFLWNCVRNQANCEVPYAKTVIHFAGLIYFLFHLRACVIIFDGPYRLCTRMAA
jgi:hypothetical protein